MTCSDLHDDLHQNGRCVKSFFGETWILSKRLSQLEVERTEEREEFFRRMGLKGLI